MKEKHHKESHHKHHGHHKERMMSGERGVSEPKMGNMDPDKGPPMTEGGYRFNKGYVSDDEHFSPHGVYPGSKERGNDYMKLQNEAVEGDSKKLFRSKFTKIA
jgi:hypothetical protein